jgi:hypothetical protein
MKNIFLILLATFSFLKAQESQIMLVEDGYLRVENGVITQFWLKSPDDYEMLVFTLRQIPENYLLLQNI